MTVVPFFFLSLLALGLVVIGLPGLIFHYYSGVSAPGDQE